MGVLLITIQTAEKIIQMVITYVLPKENLSLENLLKLQTEYRKSTLGHFIKELRKRTHIESSFDKKLSDFLEMRNDLIHDVRRIKGFDLNTEEGLSIASGFIKNLMEHANYIAGILAGLVRAWQIQNNINLGDAENNDFIRGIDKDFLPLINDTFYRIDD